MRTRVTDYTITINDSFVFVNIAIPAGKSPTSSATTKPMREAIRLIIDETAKVTFCSSMKKDNIVDILPNNPSSGYCSVKFAIPEGKTITTSDHFTIEMDWGDDLGAPGDSASANTVFGKIKEIYEYLAGQTPEDIPEGLGDRMNLLLQFFGIAGTYEAEAVGQETTDNPVINECKTRYAEVFGDLLPSGFVMPNSVTIDGTTYTGTVS